MKHDEKPTWGGFLKELGIKRVALVKVNANPDELQNKDVITVEHSFFDTVKEAQEAIRQEINALIAQYSKELTEEHPEVGSTVWMFDGEDYAFEEMGAWMAYPDPVRWQIIKFN